MEQAAEKHSEEYFVRVPAEQRTQAEFMKESGAYTCGFHCGANWEAQRSAVLLRALEHYANPLYRVAAIGEPDRFGRYETRTEPAPHDPEIARAALLDYEGEKKE